MYSLFWSQPYDNSFAALLGPGKAQPLKSCENTAVGGIWHLGSCKNMEQVFSLPQSLQLRPKPKPLQSAWLFVFGVKTVGGSKALGQ